MGVRLVDLADDVELTVVDVNVEDEGEDEAQAVAKGEKSVEEAGVGSAGVKSDGDSGSADDADDKE
ncbi:hypothetical protein HN289_19405, partial [Acinetobacter baumannii]|nr:hypothetical protein [Acinetobacter baumannii]